MSVFIRLLTEEDKELALAAAIGALRQGDSDKRIYNVKPASFQLVPGAPFAYWVSPKVRDIFMRLHLVRQKCSVDMGMSTKDDDRFVRLWWEVSTALVHWDAKYRRYAKGGTSSSSYVSVDCVVLAEDDFRELKANLNQKYHYLKGNTGWVLHPEYHYGQAGLTFGRRVRRFKPHPLPRDVVFSDSNPTIFPPDETDLIWLSSYFSSHVVQCLLSIFAPPRKMEVGYIESIPYPSPDHHTRNRLTEASVAQFTIGIKESIIKETDSRFLAPLDYIRLTEVPEVIVDDSDLETLVAEMLGLEEEDLCALLSTFTVATGLTENDDGSGEESGKQEDEEICNKVTKPSEERTRDHLFYYIGIAFGRWDARIAMDPSLAPKLPAPFDPLPVCPPGMLIGPEGHPATPNRIVSEEWLHARSDANILPAQGSVKRAIISDSEYPLDICWNGILVDDPGHPDDIITRISQVFDAIWQDRAHEIYAEAIEILDSGRDDLRPWFRTNFFAEHIKRYSKSRRKAPIYWCLSTPSRSYAVWLYYHRFSKDTLYKVHDCAKLKLQLEERKMSTLRVEIGDSPTSAQRRQLADQEKFVAELKTFHEEIALTAPLWKPDLNDGVIINFAPLWRLAPQPSTWQKECKQTWDALVRGDYDWAHLAMHLWPERVLPKCHKDRSLAIAHGLEESLWKADKDGKWKPRALSLSELNDLLAARSSRSVKDALEKLLAASSAAGNGGRRPRR